MIRLLEELRSKQQILVRFLKRKVTKSSAKRYRAKVLDTPEDAKYNLESKNFEAAESAVDQDISSFLRDVYLYVAI